MYDLQAYMWLFCMKDAKKACLLSLSMKITEKLVQTLKIETLLPWKTPGKFSNRVGGGLTGPQILEGGCNFETKLKSGIFNDKKNL